MSSPVPHVRAVFSEVMIPLTVSFRGMEASETLAALIREETATLERFFPRILRCRVVVEQPHRHHRAGAPIHVRVQLHVPGDEIVVDRHATLHEGLEHEESEQPSKTAEIEAPLDDPALAVREAFRTAARRLQDDVRHLQGKVKTHEQPATGHVARLFPDEEYGFLETPDGHEVYFHADSVLDGDFAHLTVGDRVRFVEEEGEEGPQASTVHVMAAHRP